MIWLVNDPPSSGSSHLRQLMLLIYHINAKMSMLTTHLIHKRNSFTVYLGLPLAKIVVFCYNHLEIVAIRSHRLTVRTPGFHPGNPGSIPGEITNKNAYPLWMGLFISVFLGESKPDCPIRVRTAENGSSQGRKPDDERHRLRRGREKFGTNFIVTNSRWEIFSGLIDSDCHGIIVQYENNL